MLEDRHQPKRARREPPERGARRTTRDAFVARVAEVLGMLTRLQLEGLCVFLKTAKPFPYADTNVDVLIPEASSARRLHDALREKGFQPVFTWEPRKTLLVPPRGAANPVAVHVYRELGWYGVPYLDGTAVLQRSQTTQWEGMWLPVPSPSDDFAIGALHALFEQEALTLGDIWHLGALQGELTLDQVLAELGEASLTAHWTIVQMWELVVELKGRVPSLGSWVDTETVVEQATRPVWRVPERLMLKAFGVKLKEEFQKRGVRTLPSMVYAYGLIHPAKRLGLIRG